MICDRPPSDNVSGSLTHSHSLTHSLSCHSLFLVSFTHVFSSFQNGSVLACQRRRWLLPSTWPAHLWNLALVQRRDRSKPNCRRQLSSRDHYHVCAQQQ